MKKLLGIGLAASLVTGGACSAETTNAERVEITVIAEHPIQLYEELPSGGDPGPKGAILEMGKTVIATCFQAKWDDVNFGVVQIQGEGIEGYSGINSYFYKESSLFTPMYDVSAEVLAATLPACER